MILLLLEKLRIGRRVCLWSCFGKIHHSFIPRWRRPRWAYVYPFTSVGVVLLLEDNQTHSADSSYIRAWWYTTDTPPGGLWRYRELHPLDTETLDVELRTQAQIDAQAVNSLTGESMRSL